MILRKELWRDEPPRFLKLLEARKAGKTAFLIMDKLVVYDRPPDPDRIERSKNRPRSSGGSASDQKRLPS